MGSRGPRRLAREAALQVLFAADSATKIDANSVRLAFESVANEFSLPSRARDRAFELAVGVASHLEEIDGSISRASDRWKLNRLATVERNVLRVATYELLFEQETPREVVIDEAVEIARRFAGDLSPSFVNGVLDVIAHAPGSDAQ